MTSVSESLVLFGLRLVFTSLISQRYFLCPAGRAQLHPAGLCGSFYPAGLQRITHVICD